MNTLTKTNMPDELKNLIREIAYDEDIMPLDKCMKFLKISSSYAEKYIKKYPDIEATEQEIELAVFTAIMDEFTTLFIETAKGEGFSVVTLLARAQDEEGKPDKEAEEAREIIGSINSWDINVDPIN